MDKNFLQGRRKTVYVTSNSNVVVTVAGGKEEVVYHWMLAKNRIKSLAITLYNISQKHRDR